MTSMNFDEAAHLLRRAGFGGPPGEIEDLASRGREAAVDFLLNYNTIDNREMDGILDESFDFNNPINVNRNEIQRWWFARMVFTKRHLEEKLTLFWHNHFATAFSKVPDLLMYVQNLALRKNALERFDKLLLEVARDPAMLLWLDGVTNVRGRPNENFGRELQELFTMGISDVVTGQANYTEDDVKEIARAFTGWKFRRPNSSEPFTFQFFVNPNEHDNGNKTVYGQTANFTGEDIITVVSAKPATARYLVKKLFDFFVYPLSSSDEDKATIDRFADVYMRTDHSIKELVRAIFVSDEFFSNRARFALVKTPVEFIVGAIRMLDATYNSGTTQRRDTSLYTRSALMGMQLFNPPDVAGWGLHLDWVNTALMLERFNFANALLTNRPNNTTNPGAFVTLDALRRFTKANPKKTVKRFLSVLGPLVVDSETIAALRVYLTSDDRGNEVEWVVDDQRIDRKVRGLVHLIMCMPEFQRN